MDPIRNKRFMAAADIRVRLMSWAFRIDSRGKCELTLSSFTTLTCPAIRSTCSLGICSHNCKCLRLLFHGFSKTNYLKARKFAFYMVSTRNSRFSQLNIKDHTELKITQSHSLSGWGQQTDRRKLTKPINQSKAEGKELLTSDQQAYICPR